MIECNLVSLLVKQEKMVEVILSCDVGQYLSCEMEARIHL